MIAIRNLPGLLNGDVAVVTGAAQGNGAAIARGLAASGASIAVVDSNRQGAALVAASIVASGGRAIACGLDVTDRTGCLEAAILVERELGPISILVNNAGILSRDALDAADYLQRLDSQLAVNLTGMANVTVAFLDQLKRTRGRIINMGSIASFVAYRNASAYAASKGAVLQFTKALAVELAPHGVRVNGLAPGVIATPMTEVTRANPDAIGRFLAQTPLGRVGEPEELVGPVLFLASPLSSYITGVMLPVDGGYLAQ